MKLQDFALDCKITSCPAFAMLVDANVPALRRCAVPTTITVSCSFNQTDRPSMAVLFGLVGQLLNSTSGLKTEYMKHSPQQRLKAGLVGSKDIYGIQSLDTTLVTRETLAEKLVDLIIENQNRMTLPEQVEICFKEYPVVDTSSIVVTISWLEIFIWSKCKEITQDEIYTVMMAKGQVGSGSVSVCRKLEDFISYYLLIKMSLNVIVFLRYL